MRHYSRSIVLFAVSTSCFSCLRISSDLNQDDPIHSCASLTDSNRWEYCTFAFTDCDESSIGTWQSVGRKEYDGATRCRCTRAMHSTGGFSDLCCAFWAEPLETPSPTPSPTSASAEGDPHVTAITGERFDLYKTGWSTFIEIPRDSESGGSPEFLVRANVRPYWGEDQCAPSFIEEVTISGSWVGKQVIGVRAGSLETSRPFAFKFDEDPWQFVDEASAKNWTMNKVMITAGVSNSDIDVWGPDARLTLKADDLELIINQHTEGRYDTGNTMLDLSFAADSDYFDVGGWLGVDGPRDAGSPPAGCEMSRHSRSGSSMRWKSKRRGIRDCLS